MSLRRVLICISLLIFNSQAAESVVERPATAGGIKLNLSPVKDRIRLNEKITLKVELEETKSLTDDEKKLGDAIKDALLSDDFERREKAEAVVKECLASGAGILWLKHLRELAEKSGDAEFKARIEEARGTFGKRFQNLEANTDFESARKLASAVRLQQQFFAKNEWKDATLFPYLASERLKTLGPFGKYRVRAMFDPPTDLPLPQLATPWQEFEIVAETDPALKTLAAVLPKGWSLGSLEMEHAMQPAGWSADSEIDLERVLTRTSDPAASSTSNIYPAVMLNGFEVQHTIMLQSMPGVYDGKFTPGDPKSYEYLGLCEGTKWFGFAPTAEGKAALKEIRKWLAERNEPEVKTEKRGAAALKEKLRGRKTKADVLQWLLQAQLVSEWNMYDLIENPIFNDSLLEDGVEIANAASAYFFSDDKDKRAVGSQVLRVLNKDAMPVLLRGLRSEDPENRRTALDFIRSTFAGRAAKELNEKFKPLYEQIVRIALEDDNFRPHELLNVVAAFPDAARNLVPLLVEVVSNEGSYSSDQRFAAFSVLNSFYEDDEAWTEIEGAPSKRVRTWWEKQDIANWPKHPKHDELIRRFRSTRRD